MAKRKRSNDRLRIVRPSMITSSSVLTRPPTSGPGAEPSNTGTKRARDGVRAPLASMRSVSFSTLRRVMLSLVFTPLTTYFDTRP